MGRSEDFGLSWSEREEFRRAFERTTTRLPKMFRPFWHRWEVVVGHPPELVVYAEDNSEVLRLTRLGNGCYRAAGVTAQGTVIYAGAAPSITDAIRSSGLL